MHVPSAQVPQRFEAPGAKGLGAWVARQRLLWRNGELADCRVAQLAAIGVEPN